MKALRHAKGTKKPNASAHARTKPPKATLAGGSFQGFPTKEAWSWCSRQIAAEKLGDRYVYVWKPNPSLICAPQPDFESAEKAIRETLEIARGCNLVIVMKDTSTFHQEPWRITRWSEMASRLAKALHPTSP